MLDTDDCKYYDAFGHEVANAVLRILAGGLAGVLRRSGRAHDLMARDGGRGVRRAARRPAWRCRGGRGAHPPSGRRPLLPAGRKPRVRAGHSLRGGAALADDVHTLEELIDAAGEAVYWATRAGKNKVTVAAEEAA
jgi:GGDEF domain-containing protein